MDGVRRFEDPPKDIKLNEDGTVEGWYVSPSKQAAADRRTIDESFDALHWRRRFDRTKKLLRKRNRMIVALSRKIGDLERRMVLFSQAGRRPLTV